MRTPKTWPRAAALPTGLLVLLCACETQGPLGTDDGEPALSPAVVAGNGFSCALDRDRRAFCWGLNDRGQLGQGTVSAEGGVEGPGPVAGDYEFFSISAGDAGVCGLTVDQQVVCWGDGRLFARSADEPVPTPTAVAISIGPVVRVSTGGLHGCALTEAGQTACWGTNDVLGGGQLGDGTTVSSATARTVAGDAVFALVQAGYLHSCGVTEDGDVRCWGSNLFGALNADQATASESSPVPVPGVPDAVALDVGGLATCSLESGGRAWCWGANAAGQLGNGASGASSGPDRVLVQASFAALAVPAVNRLATHACALTVDGTAFCWGANDAGQLGRETETECTMGSLTLACSPTPGTIPGIAFRQIATGADHTCGVSEHGRILCWGSDERGQLGGSVGGTTLIPVEVRLDG